MEQFGKSSLRLSFISGALWTPWHKSCLPCPGHWVLPAPATPRAASHQRLPPCTVLPTSNSRTHGAVEAGEHWEGLSMPPAHLWVLRFTEQQQAKLDRDSSSDGGPGDEGGSCKPALTSKLHWASHSFAFIAGVRKSYLTLLGVCLPRKKHQLTAGLSTADQRVLWSRSGTRETQPLEYSELATGAVWNAEPALLPCAVSSSQLALFASGKCACETKQFKTLGKEKHIVAVCWFSDQALGRFGCFLPGLSDFSQVCRP